MICSLTQSFSVRLYWSVHECFWAHYLQTLFLFQILSCAYIKSHLNRSRQDIANKKFAQGHIHLPILAKFRLFNGCVTFFLLCFRFARTRSVWSCAFFCVCCVCFSLFLAIAFGFCFSFWLSAVSRMFFPLSLQPLFPLRTHKIYTLTRNFAPTDPMVSMLLLLLWFVRIFFSFVYAFDFSFKCKLLHTNGFFSLVVSFFSRNECVCYEHWTNWHDALHVAMFHFNSFIVVESVMFV